MGSSGNPVALYVPIATALLFVVSAAMADTVTIAGDEWCPFNCEPESDRPGYMIEVAKIALAKAGHTVEYRVLPWARAVKEARAGHIAGIVGAYIDDAPDFVFPERELGRGVESVFVRKSSTFVFKNFQSLQDVSIGVVNGYAYGSAELNAHIKQFGNNPDKVQFVYDEKAQERNLTKLEAGRMEVVVENSAVFWHTASRLKLTDKFKEIGRLGEPKNTYIAFSSADANSRAYAKALSDGVDVLRKSGDLNKILQKYGLRDWR